jgi:hypothetical protein
MPYMVKGTFVAVEYPPVFERDAVDGKNVVKDVVLESGLSKHLGKFIPIHGIRVLTLDDGTTIHGCRDCVTVGSRGEVMAHRSAFHGVSPPSRRTQVDDEVPMLPYPKGAQLSMTLYELMDLAEHIGDWEEVLAGMEEHNQRLQDKVIEVTQQLKAEEREHNKLKKRLRGLIGSDA